MGRIIDKDKALKRLAKEIVWFDREKRAIEKNWERYAAVAEEIMDDLPAVRLFSSEEFKYKSHLKARLVLTRVFHEKDLDSAAQQIIKLIIELSSKDFARASRAYRHIRRYGRRSLPWQAFRFVATFLVLCALDEALSGGISNTVAYFTLDYSSEARGVITRSDSRLTLGPGAAPVYDMEYRFLAEDGNSYIGNRVDFWVKGDHNLANVLSSYPAGKQVVVYYDKTAPEYPVLERSGLGLSFWLMVPAVLFLSLLVALL